MCVHVFVRFIVVGCAWLASRGGKGTESRPRYRELGGSKQNGELIANSFVVEITVPFKGFWTSHLLPPTSLLLTWTLV